MLIGFDASRAFVSEKTGTENYSYQLLKALTEIDKKNQYLVYTRNQPDIKLPENFNYRKINWTKLWTQAGLSLEIFRKKPDILFIPAHTLPILRPNGLKTIVTIHDLGSEFLPQYHSYYNKLYLNASTKWAVNWATSIIAVSNTTKNDLVKRLKANPKKIEVVYEGVEHNKFKIQNSKVKIRKILNKYNISDNFVLFVGTIQPRKNLERLIEAFSILTKNSKLKTKNLQLIIVGKPGWLYDQIYSAPKKFGIEDRVKFLDYVDSDDLPYIYNAARVFVLPSLLEGFGLPVLEAMACGCPTVVSKDSSLAEIAQDAAILVSPYDSNDIARAIDNVLSDQKLSMDLKNKGLVQSKKFSWERCAQETIAVFEESLNR